MKEKLVMWANGAQEEKLLLAIELVADKNEVLIHKFPADIATEAFYNKLMNEWKSGQEVVFESGFETITRPLSVTEDLLPEDLKVDRTDLINRAKSEWHFIVLSSKLFELYKSEISDLKDKVEQASEYTQALWEEAKGFWDKVQNQIIERNLFRDHAQEIKRSTNDVFDKLKTMRKVLDQKFKANSKELAHEFRSSLDTINAKINEGKSLQPLFEELKNLQSKFKSASFSRDDRSKIWNYLDETFKTIKEKRFGNSSKNPTSSLDRIKNRYDGLLKAIERMQHSINRDQRDKNRENDFINKSDGQLESQLRQAKLQMIDQRIQSKQVKLDDMLKTKVQLESKMAKEQKRQEEAEQKKALNKEKAIKKAEIAKRIADESNQVIAENKDKLAVAVATLAADDVIKEAATEQNNTETDKKESIDNQEASSNKEESSIMDTIEDVVENVTDKIKDVLESVTEKIDEVIDSVTQEEE